MMDIEENIAAVILLNGGKIVGKTRLQKTAYLLEVMGLGFGVWFDYHKYGPFSPEVAFAADDAESLGYIQTKDEPGYHSIPYKIFSATDSAPRFEKADAEPRRAALEAMEKCSAIVLELAATAVYLERNGYPDNAWEEMKKRKTLKASAERVAKAQELVATLKL